MVVPAAPATSAHGHPQGQTIAWLGRSFVLLGLGGALVISSSVSYLLYHSLVEFFTISVALLLGVVSWYTYPVARNGMLAFIGIVYPAVATIDLAHTLAYEGMNVLPPAQGADAATQLWLAARYYQAAAMVIALAFIGRDLPRGTLAVAAMTLAGLLIALVAADLFPTAYIAGIGLTPFKVWSEYVIIVLLLAGLGLLLRKRKLIDAAMRRMLVAALLCFIVAEFAFTLYVATYDLSNFVGHIGKLAGFSLVFLAVIRTGLQEPFRLLADEISTYDAIPQPVIVVDRAGRIRQLNRAAHRAVPGVALGAESHAWFHPRDLPRSACPVCQAVADCRADDQELHYPEQERWRVVSVAPLSLGGVAQAMVQVLYDITGRKAAEIAHRDAENRIRHLLDSVGEGICGVDRAGRATFINAAATRMLGYSADEMVGQSLHERIHCSSSATTETLHCPLRKALADGHPHRSDNELFCRKDGTSLPVAYLAMPITVEETVVGAVISFVDISARLAAQQALQESEQRFRSIASAAQDAILMIDGTGRIDYWNPAAECMLGYRAEEALGQDAHRLLAPERYWAACEPGMGHFAETGSGPAIGKVVELAAVRKDGVEFPVELSIAALQLGGKWHAVGIIRDIRDRKRLEEALRAAAAREEDFANAVINSLPGFYFLVDSQGRLHRWNRALEQLTFCSAEQLARRDLEALFCPSDRHAVRAAVAEIFTHGHAEVQASLLNHAGNPVPCLISGCRIQLEGTTFLNGTALDISALQQAEAALARSERRLRHALQCAHAGTWEVELETGRTHWSTESYRLHGLDATQDVSYESWLARIHPDDRGPLQRTVETALADRLPDYNVDYRTVTDQGERWLTQFGRIQYAPDRTPQSILCLDLDITERKHVEELLQQLAKHDHLTGLYNRLYVSDCFCLLLKRAQRYGRPCSVVIFDIDHFKAVNDTYGHNRGDVVLKRIADTVRPYLREADAFVRWGGEEFLIIAPETDLEGARRLAEKVRTAIAAIVFVDMPSITASFGVAQYRPGEPSDTLINRADDALYRAKAHGRNRVEAAAAGA